MHHDFHILPRRVENLQDLFVGHQGKEGLEVQALRHGINQAIDFASRDLNEAKVRPIGGFAHEFRVHRHESLMRQRLAKRCQRFCVSNEVHDG